MPVITINDDALERPEEPQMLTTQAIAGPPDTLEVSDEKGLLATLTTGSRTVRMRGPVRTLRETKRPVTDAFDRTTTAGWGPSPGAGNWSNANGVDADYSTNGSAGVMTMTAANSSRHTSLIDDMTDVDARMSWSLTVMPSGNASSLALSFGYQGVNNQYRARLTVLTSAEVRLILEKEVAGSTTTLGALTTVGTGYVVGDVWNIRAQRAGTILRCKAWKSGDAEPSTWVHEVDDSSLGAGRVGVRGLASTNSTAIPFDFLVHDLEIISGTWPDPPAVTHDTWVRVLGSAFDGTWTDVLADQIRAWASDSTPDALAYAMMFLTGAPAVTSTAQDGAQTLGQSDYGPLNPDGTRQEGADFHEYMGIPWTFPSGETATASPEWEVCLDCSGFVRMVYGYHLGVPLTRNDPASFDGNHIPRQTKDMGPDGPGVIVAEAVDTAPPLTALRIGDIPFFDADTSDAVAGQLDHNGIYLGVDSAGRHRFVNSRKTPNGPTFADIGGDSALDGAGTYATSLRLIRRF